MVGIQNKEVSDNTILELISYLSKDELNNKDNDGNTAIHYLATSIVVKIYLIS